MNKFLMGSILLISSFSQAATDCMGYAKYGAVRAYRAEVGVVQGSEGIEVEGFLEYKNSKGEMYTIEIFDNNEDSEYFSVGYSVFVRPLDTGKCQVLRVKKLIEM